MTLETLSSPPVLVAEDHRCHQTHPWAATTTTTTALPARPSARTRTRNRNPQPGHLAGHLHVACARLLFPPNSSALNSPSHSLTHKQTNKHTHTHLLHSRWYLLTYLLTHSLTHSLTHLPTSTAYPEPSPSPTPARLLIPGRHNNTTNPLNLASSSFFFFFFSLFSFSICPRHLSPDLQYHHFRLATGYDFISQQRSEAGPLRQRPPSKVYRVESDDLRWPEAPDWPSKTLSSRLALLTSIASQCAFLNYSPPPLSTSPPNALLLACLCCRKHQACFYLVAQRLITLLLQSLLLFRHHHHNHHHHHHHHLSTSSAVTFVVDAYNLAVIILPCWGSLRHGARPRNRETRGVPHYSSPYPSTAPLQPQYSNHGF